MLPDRLRRLPAILILLFVLAPVLAPGPTLAQAPVLAQDQASPEGGTAIVLKQREALADLTARVDEFERRLAASADDDARMVEIRGQLQALSQHVLAAAVSFRPRLTEITARLDQLGPPPAEGQPAEPDIVTAERQTLTTEKADISAVVGQAESLSIRINGLVESIANMRRELFQSTLTRRFTIDYTLFGQVWDAFGTSNSRLWTAVSSWFSFATRFKLNSMVAAGFFALLAAAVLMFGGRRLFGQVFDPDPAVAEPSYLSRLSVAFWSTLVPSAALAVFLGATYLLFDYFDVLRGDIGAVMRSLFTAIAIVYFVHRLARAVLSPDLPNWRLIAVEPVAARRIVWLVSATVLFSSLDSLLNDIYEMQGAPLPLAVGESLVSTVAIGVLVILIGLVKPFAGEDGNRRPWPVLIRLPILALGGLTLLAALSGYIGFARFLSQQIVVTGAILATMYLGFLSARAVSQEEAFGKTAVGGRLKERLRLDDTSLDQFGLLASIVINLFVVVVGLPLILLQWGFRWGDIGAWVVRAAGGFSVGTFTFSPAGILTGILVFLIGYFATRWFQGWLDGSVMARGRVDAGVRNSIRTVVGYVGLALAVLIGLSAAGINLSSLALVAGGLSLGIGFGLQNIVQNFVSGLILLAERPFKAGDWIVAGGTQGIVKKISVRATEIETFQRQTVILPNSELINAAVGNWTHRNKLGRTEIKVSVAFGADARRVHEILREITTSHPLVLKNPEPFVSFNGVGDSTLDFEILLYLADITAGGGVKNELRFTILERMRQEGIDMPIAPRTVRLLRGRESDLPWPLDDEKAEAQLLELLEKRAAEQKAAAAPRRGRRKSKFPEGE